MIDPSTNAGALQRRLFGYTRLARGSLVLLVLVTIAGAAVAVAQMVAASHAIAAVHPRGAWTTALPPGRAATPVAAEGAGASAGTAADTAATEAASVTAETARASSRAAWMRPLMLLLALVLVRAVLAAAAEHCAQRIATRVKSHLRTRTIDRTLARGPRALAREQTGELVTTIVEGIEKLDAYYRRFVPQTIVTAIVPLAIVLAVAALDPASALILAITGPLIPIFMWLLGTLAAQRTRAQWQALSTLGGSFLDLLQGLPALTLSGRDRDAADRLDRASERLRVATMDVLKVAFLSGFVLEIAATLGTALVAVGVGVRMIEGWIAFQPGLAVLLLAPEFYLPFRQLGQRHHAGMEGVAAAERIVALLDAPVPGMSALGTTEATAPRGANDKRSATSGLDRAMRDASSLTSSPDEPLPPPSRLTLSLRDVTFVYPGARVPTLAHVSLDFPPRSFTAIVGPSGAGKSTLAALLLRLLEPASGALFANDRAARGMSADAWRTLVTLAPQRPHFFAGSILDNLRLGHPSATLDEVRAAARLAEADAFISALPHGYHTAIDEVAGQLSGGERQRLAIARALVKPAPVLVLDEPGSSLDPVSEAAIARVLARLAGERTVIVIAHRQATIQRADRIMRMDGSGRVTLEAAHVRAGGRVESVEGDAA